MPKSAIKSGHCHLAWVVMLKKGEKSNVRRRRDASEHSLFFFSKGNLIVKYVGHSFAHQQKVHYFLQEHDCQSLLLLQGK